MTIANRTSSQVANKFSAAYFDFYGRCRYTDVAAVAECLKRYPDGLTMIEVRSELCFGTNRIQMVLPIAERTNNIVKLRLGKIWKFFTPSHGYNNHNKLVAERAENSKRVKHKWYVHKLQSPRSVDGKFVKNTGQPVPNIKYEDAAEAFAEKPIVHLHTNAGAVSLFNKPVGMVNSIFDTSHLKSTQL